MKWTVLHPIHVEEFFSKQLKGELQAINEDVRRLEESRAALEQKLAQVRGEDVAALNFDNLVGVPWARVESVTILQAELRLRQRIAHMLEAVREAYLRQYERTCAEHEKAKQEIHKALVSIGYMDTPGYVIGNVQPGWVIQHPRVHQLNLDAKSVQSKSADTALENANAQALEGIKAQLTQLRDASVAM